ncbi:MAG: phosphate-starvation-inducible PsiE family protein [Actinobacteria bacterium]|nr:phosphate-starvation-inducible PsiE family protein [Actinomycetota bacterium]MBW3643622.1 phosphate-starvation-inducible PsiE family protein [Actinomycetota bacterium]
MAENDEATTITSRALRVVEDVVYALISVILTGGALALLVKAGYDLATGADRGVSTTVSGMLDTLLLVFILIELLSAVRTTLVERQLLAEPFLLVGMIATIKEIVIGSLEAKALAGKDAGAFNDVMTEIGVLGGVLLVLALSSYLLRRKEREPEEGDENDAAAQ